MSEVTVTVRAADLESAIEAIDYAHADYCMSDDHCSCNAEAERLQAALDAART